MYVIRFNWVCIPVKASTLKEIKENLVYFRDGKTLNWNFVCGFWFTVSVGDWLQWECK